MLFSGAAGAIGEAGTEVGCGVASRTTAAGDGVGLVRCQSQATKTASTRADAAIVSLRARPLGGFSQTVSIPCDADTGDAAGAPEGTIGAPGLSAPLTIWSMQRLSARAVASAVGKR